ncbi:N-acetyl-gamma-glutamyl-phosphate reductase [Candidatus Woesearchaeota archaeon]|jgi:LysW-gamma-L-alpha-aminoadipyl-6-phosphate/LysW-L-glutamyl-5-phosphate reductase|nr:N-acetyl-gamma-glutamyl-phosphate reductase [Candidatus Woesearchaeota archaeon]MBT5272740.1 N-acetyl-gamma-glutamyl-phosphate reductase [Candidatus Woesearchaeota archaeon]MBT6040351.1 N-acetyl-gamma-glutamyl-phosphate reductase [Candidatus Woesearchaeota archaeon]MBT6337015.1 N-acetyl-gamma-glutamyl-phosphate reductase [Candidatus Woesearchaeota archaeon]MBT7926901.1 N-acetyl-gamma-glutamyl-phosphate reductase [Candidatus Woesearchaeota archaeon]
MNKIKVSIVGASGYAGGDLLRLLLQHPNVELHQVTSERFAGKPVTIVHPNLRKQTTLKFSSVNDLEKVDLLFTALPHAKLMNNIENFRALADRIIDLSGDFRLKTAEDYKRWYDLEHPNPELLNEFVYGIVELHREEMKSAKLISSAGCNATSTILPLWPLFKNDLVDLSKPVIAEAKCGSSEAGNKASDASHHPERSGCVRSYKPTRHRHTAEMIQELGNPIEFSATTIEMVRGILMTAHVFLKEGVTELDVWKTYRKEYGEEPFIRIVKERSGIYRYPEPKILAGTNFCDIGFELDPNTRRLVVIGAIDNLMKGAAGQAVHAMNVANGFEETAGLGFTGLHPI